MRSFSSISPIFLLYLLASSITSTSAADTTPGYFTSYSTIPSNETISFGRHYAVLNLDLVNFLVNNVVNTTQGSQWISSTAKWIDAVHAQDPNPLQIFTRVYFANPRYPDLQPGGAFTNHLSSYISSPPGLLENSTYTAIYPAFTVDEDSDVVLQKVRYYAGVGNDLELILSSQGIDTVILSGIRTSGVILSTAYRLFDLNYKIYIISNNTIENAPYGLLTDQGIKQGILPKLPVDVITVEQAIQGLENSGPAIY